MAGSSAILGGFSPPSPPVSPPMHMDVAILCILWLPMPVYIHSFWNYGQVHAPALAATIVPPACELCKFPSELLH